MIKYTGTWLVMMLCLIKPVQSRQEKTEEVICYTDVYAMLEDWQQHLPELDGLSYRLSPYNDFDKSYSAIWHKEKPLIDYELYFHVGKCPSDKHKWTFPIVYFQPMYLPNKQNPK
jgi:hypothetical protein